MKHDQDISPRWWQSLLLGKGEKEASGRGSLHITLELASLCSSPRGWWCPFGVLGVSPPSGNQDKRPPKAGDRRRRSQLAKGHTVSIPVSAPAPIQNPHQQLWGWHWAGAGPLGTGLPTGLASRSRVPSRQVSG